MWFPHRDLTDSPKLLLTHKRVCFTDVLVFEERNPFLTEISDSWVLRVLYKILFVLGNFILLMIPRNVA